LLKNIQLLAIVTVACALKLVSAPLPFTQSGTFTLGNQTQLFQLDLAVNDTVSIRTTGFSAGGFDPILSFFDASGLQVALNNDAPGGCPGLVPQDPVTGACYDSYIQSSLLAGTYYLVLTQYGNSPGTTIFDPFTFSPFSSDPLINNPTFACDASAPVGSQFCDSVTGAVRTGFWALEIGSGNSLGDVVDLGPTDPASVPEPGTVTCAALGLALIAAGKLARR
jgi:hypothetical protein